MTTFSELSDEQLIGLHKAIHTDCLMPEGFGVFREFNGCTAVRYTQGPHFLNVLLYPDGRIGKFINRERHSFSLFAVTRYLLSIGFTF